MPARQMNVYYIYITYVRVKSDWDRSSDVFINDSTTTTSCSQDLISLASSYVYS